MSSAATTANAASPESGNNSADGKNVPAMTASTANGACTRQASASVIGRARAA